MEQCPKCGTNVYADCSELCKSQLEKLAEMATEFCTSRSMDPSEPKNIVRALNQMALLYKPRVRAQLYPQ